MENAAQGLSKPKPPSLNRYRDECPRCHAFMHGALICTRCNRHFSAPIVTAATHHSKAQFPNKYLLI